MPSYSINPAGIASEHFPDETIILNLPKGNYYSLRGTGQFIWTQLEQGTSTESIVEAVTLHYAVDIHTAQPAVEAFLVQLEQEELIIVTSARTTDSPIVPTPVINQPFTAPVFEVYTDMQELLMLDPIHDSDPDKGWPYAAKS